MKKNILLGVILMSILLFTSCKTSQSHCDAYGNKNTESNDLEFDGYKGYNHNMNRVMVTP